MTSVDLLDVVTPRISMVCLCFASKEVSSSVVVTVSILMRIMISKTDESVQITLGRAVEWCVCICVDVGACVGVCVCVRVCVILLGSAVLVCDSMRLSSQHEHFCSSMSHRLQSGHSTPEDDSHAARTLHETVVFVGGKQPRGYTPFSFANKGWMSMDVPFLTSRDLSLVSGRIVPYASRPSSHLHTVLS